MMSVWTAGCSINTFYFLTLIRQIFLSPASVLGGLYLWGRGQTRWTDGICWGFEAAPPSAPVWRSNLLRSHHRRSSWRTAGNTCEAKDCSTCTHLVASWQQLIQPWLHSAYRKTTDMPQRHVTFSTGTHVTWIHHVRELMSQYLFTPKHKVQHDALTLHGVFQAQWMSGLCYLSIPEAFKLWSCASPWVALRATCVTGTVLKHQEVTEHLDTGDVWGGGGTGSDWKPLLYSVHDYY